MKRIILILTLVMLAAFSHSAFAADIISFNTSEVGSTTETGLRFAGDGEAKIVIMEEDMTALYLNNAVGYNNVWSKTYIDYLVLETRLMLKEGASGKEFIRFRTPQAIYWDLLAMNTNGFSSCGKNIPDIEIETGRWYDIKLALKKNPSYMVDVWIDGAKVLSTPFEKLSDLPQEGFQIRFEGGEAGLYVGDTRMYIPEDPVSEVINPTLSTVDEPVSVKLESEEIDESSITKENIKIIDNTYGDNIDFELERTEDGIKLTFAEALIKDNTYTIDLGRVVDISGQSFKEAIFRTPLPDDEYIIEGIKLYNGFDKNEEITKPVKGAMTVSAELKNGGIKEREAALVCVLYEDGIISGVGMAKTVLGETEETELSVSVESNSSRCSINAMLWDGFLGRPLADSVDFEG